MFYLVAEGSSPKAGATMHMRHDVLDVDVAGKVLRARDMNTGEVGEYRYDKLVITTGSAPWCRRRSTGWTRRSNRDACCYSRTDHAMAIKERARAARKSAVVIGAGYIGAEIAEQFSEIGVKTTLVDALDRVLANNFDATITDDVEQAFDEHGVTLALGQKVTAFRPAAGSDGIEGSGVTVVTEKGEYTADMAILGAGFRPNTALFADQLRMLKNGAIVIDDYMRASLPDNTVLDDVFAAGDSATVRYNPTGADDYIPARHQCGAAGGCSSARTSSPRRSGIPARRPPAQCSCTIWRCPPRDSPPAAAKRRGIAAKSTTITQDYRPDFMLTTTPVTTTLVWSPVTWRILGARSSCRSMTSRRRRTSCPWPFRRGSRSISSPAPTCSSSRTSASRSISSEPWPFRQWPKADPNR